MKPILQLCEELSGTCLRMISHMEGKTMSGKIYLPAGEISVSIDRVRKMKKELDDLLVEHGRKPVTRDTHRVPNVKSAIR